MGRSNLLAQRESGGGAGGGGRRGRIAYLLEIGIEQADLAEKVLGKVPEVLGCDVETRLKVNVAHIQKTCFMKPNTKNFRNYINRVPQVLGNNLDCAAQGLNCAGECNRCWARC